MQYRRMVAEEMKQYEQRVKNDRENGKQRGTLPAFFKRWADATLAPAKVPWQTKMRGMVRNSVAIVRGMTDYSRRQPNRRQAAFGNVILSSHTQPVPRVFVGIDTSGSMQKEWLEKAVVEVGGILKATGVNELEFAAIDTMIHVSKKIRSVRDIDLRGGGGTDMNPAMDYAAANKFDICIILTDGWVGSWGNPRKNLRVIAGLVQPACEKPPAWVDSVYIDD
jgi:predicted metal-dependent peptidase